MPLQTETSHSYFDFRRKGHLSIPIVATSLPAVPHALVWRLPQQNTCLLNSNCLLPAFFLFENSQDASSPSLPHPALACLPACLGPHHLGRTARGSWTVP